MPMGSLFRLLAVLGWTCDASTLLVPAYWWAATDSSGACTTADFHALAAAGDAAVAVVNPNNGPIDSSDANFAAFAACVAALGDARAIGYVYTKIADIHRTNRSLFGIRTNDMATSSSASSLEPGTQSGKASTLLRYLRK